MPFISLFYLFIYFSSNNTFLTNHTLKFEHQPGHWKVNIPFPDNKTLLSIYNTAAKPTVGLIPGDSVDSAIPNLARH